MRLFIIDRTKDKPKIQLMKFFNKLLPFLFWMIALQMTAGSTQRVYLSGHGSDDMQQWDFMVTSGMNAGKWTKIGVPSCWELQGFGMYQYGMKFYGKAFPTELPTKKACTNIPFLFLKTGVATRFISFLKHP